MDAETAAIELHLRTSWVRWQGQARQYHQGDRRLRSPFPAKRARCPPKVRSLRQGEFWGSDGCVLVDLGAGQASRFAVMQKEPVIRRYGRVVLAGLREVFIGIRLAEKQHRARDDKRTAGEHDGRPAASPPMVSALRTPLRDQRRLIFVRAREHAGKATARRGRCGFERHQGGLRAVASGRVHGVDDRKQMVNGRLPLPFRRYHASRGTPGRGCGWLPVPAVLRRQLSSDSGSSSAASTRLRPARLA